jgi:hypothetical protein
MAQPDPLDEAFERLAQSFADSDHLASVVI